MHAESSAAYHATTVNYTGKMLLTLAVAVV
jgi:hypothetical protein